MGRVKENFEKKFKKTFFFEKMLDIKIGIWYNYVV